MFCDERGYTLVRYKQPIPKIVEVGNEKYFFEVRKGVAAQWVKPEHLDKLLNHYDNHCSACGPKKLFSIASDAAYRIWMGLAER